MRHTYLSPRYIRRYNKIHVALFEYSEHRTPEVPLRYVATRFEEFGGLGGLAPLITVPSLLSVLASINMSMWIRLDLVRGEETGKDEDRLDM